VMVVMNVQPFLNFSFLLHNRFRIEKTCGESLEQENPLESQSSNSESY
jgi:hypothetical protein